MEKGLLQPDSSKKNFAFQFLYQAIILIIPLIVSPYLTRVLGGNSLGIYTYTYTIAYYFVIFAMLGINRHGQRIIAQRRHNILLLRKTFWSLFFVHSITSVLSLFAYLFYILLVCKSNTNIAFIQTIYVLSALLDITWLFYGLEKFRIVAVRNGIVKLAETICIFIFVKDSSDVGIYTLIMCLSVCVGQLVMFPQVISAIPPIKFSWNDVREHIKPMFTLFATVLAASLYTVFDKTLLGVLSTKEDVAFYEYSDKIIKIPRTFITIIGTVLFPQACVSAAKNDTGKLGKIMSNSLIVTYFIGFASIFGLLAVSNLFAVIYYGNNFSVCGNVMICMSPLILIIGLGDGLRNTYIFSFEKDSTLVKILFANAAVNLIASIILIPILGIYGAVIGTLLAEMLGFVLEIFICRKYVSLKMFISEGLPFFIIGLIMFVIVRFVSFFIDGSIRALLVQILVGAVVYLSLSFIYGLFFNQQIRNIIIEVYNGIKKRLAR